MFRSNWFDRKTFRRAISSASAGLLRDGAVEGVQIGRTIQSERLRSGSPLAVSARGFFGGAPNAVVPDDLKGGITKPSRYESDVKDAVRDCVTKSNAKVIKRFSSLDRPAGTYGSYIARSIFALVLPDILLCYRVTASKPVGVA